MFRFWKQLPNLFCFEFEISSFLLSALKNQSLPIFENKQIIVSRSITFSTFFCCQKLVFEFEISSLLLSALKNKSLPIFENKQIILSRNITFSAFFVVKLIFIVMVLETITKTCFFFSLRSLFSCFQHSRTNHCPYLRTRPIIFSKSITFSAFFCCQTCFLCYGFGNNHIWRC